MRPSNRTPVMILGGAAFIAAAAYYGLPLSGGLAHSRPPAAEGCDSTALCYRDTARVRALDHEPGRAIDARWVIFGAAGDSVELTARADTTIWSNESGERVGFGLVASHATAAHQEREPDGSTASHVHLRLPHDGVISVDASADDRGLHDTVPYTLSVRRIGGGRTPPWLRPTGQTAALTVASAQETDRFTVAPLGAADWATNPARWEIFAGRHKVALVRDSLYVVCTVPCTTPDTVMLKPSAHVTRRY